MKFRPQLESLDARVLSDATQVSIPSQPQPPLQPPQLPILPNLPPLTGPFTSPLSPTQEELQDYLGEYEAILDTISCLTPYIAQLQQLYNDAWAYKGWLVLNDVQLTALYGAAGYQAMVEAANQAITDIYNQLNEAVGLYNELVNRLEQLRPILLDGGNNATIPIPDLQPVIPALPDYLSPPTRPLWLGPVFEA